MRRVGRVAWAVLLPIAFAPTPGSAQDADLPDRPFLDSIPVPTLDFTPLEVVEREVAGVPVFHIVDGTLPLMDFAVHVRGGYGNFPREVYAAGTGLPLLLRSGGTAFRTGEELDEALEFHAVQLSVGGGGGSVTSSINVLVESMDTALVLWREMLRDPAFDTAAIAVWRGRELEAVRRREDNPGGFAFSEYNRLLYGDHPIGWEAERADFDADRVRPEVFAELHRRLLCPDNLILGVSGPLSWEEVRPRIERLLDGWPPCGDPVPPTPVPDVRRGPGVWLVPRDLDQATVVITQPVELPQADTPEYFASRIGHAILGASGLSSRLNQRLRTELGYTYGASSVWTTPRRWPGLMGATTSVRPEVVVPTLHEIVAQIERLRTEAPDAAEIRARVDEAVNGWVFNFDSPALILSRRIGFRAGELPDDWLEIFLDRIREVRPEAVRDVFRDRITPDAWVVLVVGDPERIGEGLEAFGPVTVFEPGG